MLRVIVNGEDLDLYPGTEFWITKQVHDLNDLNTRNGDIARGLTIPKTGKNERILKAFFYEGESRGPYDGFPVIVSYDGIELIQNGLLYWSDVTKNDISINFFNANTELFNSLGEKLSDLDLSDYDFTFDLTGAYALRSATSGPVVARCDWNNIESSRFLRDEPTTQWAQTIDINISGFHFYAKTLIEEIIQQSGFTLNIDQVAADSLYNELALAIPLTSFANEEAASIDGESTRTTDQSLTAGTTLIAYSNIRANGVTWNGSPDYSFQVSTNTQVECTVTVRGNFFRVGSGLATVQVVNGVDVIASETLTQSGVFDVSFTVTSSSSGSGIYQARIIIHGSSYGTITNSVFNIVSIGGSGDRDIVISEVMPDLSQADFLKGILAHQNIILQTNPITKEVELLSFDTIAVKPSQDWSNKLLENFDIVEGNVIGAYAANNEFKYKDFDDLVKTNVNDVYQFDDSRLEKYKTVVELPFEASDDSARFNNTDNNASLASVYDCQLIEPTPTISGSSGTATFTSSFAASMNIGDFINVGSDVRRVVGITGAGSGTVSSNWSSSHSSATFTIYRFKPKKRIKIHQIKSSTDTAYITDGDQSGISRPTDLDAVFNNDMLFSKIIENNYNDLMAALNRPLALTAYFIFDLFEFNNIDLLRPVYISKYGALFFINKINQYKPNKPVQVELIRL
jgi:hypothetical protein